MDYAIIRVGNKQHRVRDGETLVVDRVHTEEGETFTPDVLLGEAKVTVKVLAHERGPKIRIGKYRKRTGYKRHTGFRAATTRIEVSLGGGKATPAKAETVTPKTETPTVETAPQVEAESIAAVSTEAVSTEAGLTEAGLTEAGLTEAGPIEAGPIEAGLTGLPEGYEKFTVAAITTGAKTWTQPELEAALVYEQAHAKRKGALAALQSALEGGS
jgi:large subunit ribosomal protein L21